MVMARASNLYSMGISEDVGIDYLIAWPLVYSQVLSWAVGNNIDSHIIARPIGEYDYDYHG